MNHLRGAFAISLLPNYCEPHYEAEPKRNIPSVFQDDFSSNILQLSDLANLRTSHCKVNANAAQDFVRGSICSLSHCESSVRGAM